MEDILNYENNQNEQKNFEEQNATLDEKPISVFIKTNDEGFVTDVCSEIFINDLTGWQKIDEGFLPNPYAGDGGCLDPVCQKRIF